MHPFCELLFDIQKQPNAISASAYDTAWLAWLTPSTRDWLCDAQHLDGSWGAELEYYHDRVICTLAAINALAATSANGHDLQRLERGIKYLERATSYLSRDPHRDCRFRVTCAFIAERWPEIRTGSGRGSSQPGTLRDRPPSEDGIDSARYVVQSPSHGASLFRIRGLR